MLVPALVVVGALATAGPALAVDRYAPMKGAPGPGPARYDRVWVQQLGPKSARNVLVLVPGTNGGAGGITPVARDIVKRVPRTQVWIVDRRQQAFEDTSVFAAGGDPQAAQEYYLDFKYRAVRGGDVPFVADWGLELSLEDLRRVVLRARDGGRRRVLLGGHSAGASTAVAYAAWDFRGRAGHRDIDGLVLIDGGLRGSFSSSDLPRARSELAEIRALRLCPVEHHHRSDDLCKAANLQLFRRVGLLEEVAAGVVGNGVSRRVLPDGRCGGRAEGDSEKRRKKPKGKHKEARP